jgi:hypothetical protein
MQYKPIESCHVENAVIGKDFKLGTISFLFHVFTQNACGLTHVAFDS